MRKNHFKYHRKICGWDCQENIILGVLKNFCGWGCQKKILLLIWVENPAKSRYNTCCCFQVLSSEAHTEKKIACKHKNFPSSIFIEKNLTNYCLFQNTSRRWPLAFLLSSLFLPPLFTISANLGDSVISTNLYSCNEYYILLSSSGIKRAIVQRLLQLFCLVSSSILLRQ